MFQVLPSFEAGIAEGHEDDHDVPRHAGHVHVHVDVAAAEKQSRSVQRVNVSKFFRCLRCVEQDSVLRFEGGGARLEDNFYQIWFTCFAQRC